MNILTIENVHKRLGKTNVLKGVSLNLVQGVSHVLLGHSGSGKTTLARILGGLDKADSGNIEHANKIRVILVQQDFVVWPNDTVEKNIALGLPRGIDCHERAERINQTLNILGLVDLKQRKTCALSYGQQQRVALGRALVADADLIILDEPFAHLDPQARRVVWQEIAEMFKSKGIASLWITHNPADAFPIADRICFLGGGVIVQSDTPEAVYIKPANLLVAKFTGWVNCIGSDDWTRLGFNEPFPGSVDKQIALRPEAMKLESDDDGQIYGEILTERFMGAGYHYSISLSGHRECRVFSAAKINLNSRFCLQFLGEVCWIDE